MMVQGYSLGPDNWIIEWFFPSFLMEVLKRYIGQIAHGQFLSHALQFSGSGHNKISVPT